MKSKWIIGIDEAGRGPLAGPVAVGVSLVPEDFDWGLLPGVTDSKQLTEKKREVIYEAAQKLLASAQLQYEVSMVSATVIDRIGIVAAVKLAMDRSLVRLEKAFEVNIHFNKFSPEACPRERKASRGRASGKGLEQWCRIKLDGGLRAPDRFLLQETIIKGDQKEKVIGLASILAKVTRDRYMTHLASRANYAPYSFHLHKGYGTSTHRTAIAQYGLSDLHRVTYCKNIKVL
jgi:ribonuclease HII